MDAREDLRTFGDEEGSDIRTGNPEEGSVATAGVLFFSETSTSSRQAAGGEDVGGKIVLRAQGDYAAADLPATLNIPTMGSAMAAWRRARAAQSSSSSSATWSATATQRPWTMEPVSLSRPPSGKPTPTDHSPPPNFVQTAVQPFAFDPSDEANEQISLSLQIVNARRKARELPPGLFLESSQRTASPAGGKSPPRAGQEGRGGQEGTSLPQSPSAREAQRVLTSLKDRAKSPKRVSSPKNIGQSVEEDRTSTAQVHDKRALPTSPKQPPCVEYYKKYAPIEEDDALLNATLRSISKASSAAARSTRLKKESSQRSSAPSKAATPAASPLRDHKAGAIRKPVVAESSPSRSAHRKRDAVRKRRSAEEQSARAKREQAIAEAEEKEEEIGWFELMFKDLMPRG